MRKKSENKSYCEERSVCSRLLIVLSDCSNCNESEVSCAIRIPVIEMKQKMNMTRYTGRILIPKIEYFYFLIFEQGVDI